MPQRESDWPGVRFERTVAQRRALAALVLLVVLVLGVVAGALIVGPYRVRVTEIDLEDNIYVQRRNAWKKTSTNMVLRPPR